MNRIRNEHIRESPGMADERDKIREHWLQWFGHVM